jgi:hypothetical protein
MQIFLDQWQQPAISTSIFCAFTKYAIVMPVETKEAKTVAKAIYTEWFCKFGLSAQIHTAGGQEFVKKLSQEIFLLLNIQHTKTTPAHPQYNTDVQFFNKTVKKYLASSVGETTLDWENLLVYNTSYHSTIAMMPFELLFSICPVLPYFPNPYIDRVHYDNSSLAENFQLLQKVCFITKNITKQNGQTTRTQFDKTGLLLKFKSNGLMWYEDFFIHWEKIQNSPKWAGPAKIKTLMTLMQI